MISEMPIPLLVIQQGLHSKVNDLRALQRLATSEDFEVAYERASNEQRRVVTRLVADGDRCGVQEWLSLQELCSVSVEDLTVKELRRLAASLGIAGYQLMSKASLLSQISKRGGV